MLYTEEEIADYIRATRRIAGKMPAEKARMFFLQSYRVFDDMGPDAQAVFVRVYEQLGQQTLDKAGGLLQEAATFVQGHSKAGLPKKPDAA